MQIYVVVRGNPSMGEMKAVLNTNNHDAAVAKAEFGNKLARACNMPIEYSVSLTSESTN